MGQESDSYSQFLSSKYFCILPWIHFRLSTDGNIFTCCRSTVDTPIGSLHQNSLPEIWNSSKYKTIRSKMLTNIPIDSCSDCYQIEKINIKSMRQISNDNWLKDNINLVTSSLSNNDIPFLPQYLDLRFSNICNFKCRTCGPDYSTSWYGDCDDLGMRDFKSSALASENQKQLWHELKSILPFVKVIYFAGGEPLLHEDHYKLLDILVELNLTNIILSYNTNLSTLSFNHKNILVYWKKFDKVVIDASIDAIEKEAEYIRKGTKWESIHENVQVIKNQAPWVDFKIYSTISVLNAFHITTALKFFATHKYLNSWNDFSINILNQPELYNIRIFNESERVKLIQHYSHFSHEELPTLNLPEKDHIIEQLNLIIDYLARDTYDHHYRNLFWAFNRKLDKIRKENFLLLFPELKSLYEIPSFVENDS